MRLQIPRRIHYYILLPFAWSVVADQGSEIRPSVGQLADRVRLLVQARENRRALQVTLCAMFGVLTVVLTIHVFHDIPILGLSWRWRQQALPNYRQFFISPYISNIYVVKTALNIYLSIFRALTVVTAWAVLTPYRNDGIDPADGGSTLLWNGGIPLQGPTVLKPRHTVSYSHRLNKLSWIY